MIGPPSAPTTLAYTSTSWTRDEKRATDSWSCAATTAQAQRLTGMTSFMRLEDGSKGVPRYAVVESGHGKNWVTRVGDHPGDRGPDLRREPPAGVGTRHRKRHQELQGRNEGRGRRGQN